MLPVGAKIRWRLWSLVVWAVFSLLATPTLAGPCRGIFGARELEAVIVNAFARFAPPSLSLEMQCALSSSLDDPSGDAPFVLGECWWQGLEGSTRSTLVLMPDDAITITRAGVTYDADHLCGHAPQ